MRARRRLVAFAGVVLAVGAIAAACGVPVQESPRFERADRVPYDLLDPPTTTTAPPPTVETAPHPSTTSLCFVTATGRLIVVQRATTTSDVAVVVRLLEDGPTASEQRFGLTTTITDPALVTSATASAGVAHVDLAPTSGETVSGAQNLAVAQLVCTITAQPGIGQVVFTLGGAPIEVPRGDGSLSAGPVTAEDYAALLATG